jgi:hypothetical protein
MDETQLINKYIQAVQKRINKAVAKQPQFVQGVVLGTNPDGTANVTLGADPTPIRAKVISPYSPAEGDIVEVRRQNRYAVIHGATKLFSSPKTVSFIRSEVYRNAAWTVGVADTICPFDTLVYDPSSCMTLGAAAAFTCPIDGIYAIDSIMQANPNTLTILRLYHNGAVARQVTNTAATQCVNLATTYWCTAGDTLQIFCRASAAASAMSTGQLVAYTAFRIT